jgi:RNA polymerase sigma-70 factor (sigma-E family)
LTTTAVATSRLREPGRDRVVLAQHDVTAARGTSKRERSSIAARVTERTSIEPTELVAQMYREEGASLVRLARLFTDDRNAAEDLVQEAFIRLHRSAHRIEDPTKVAPYLRSIVLNLARDHNRRGLMSLRHREPSSAETPPDMPEDVVVAAEEGRRVVAALRDLPLRQRDCLVLRFYLDLSEREIAETLGISPNSVKTHCRRGMAALERGLEVTR